MYFSTSLENFGTYKKGVTMEALAKAQGAIKAPTKDKKVDFSANGRRIQYSYAGLADIIDAIKKPFADNGISFTQVMGFTEAGTFCLTTKLYDTTGKVFDSSTVPLPNPVQMKPQDFASYLTYFKRYSLASLVGIESEEDDDAISAQAHASRSPNASVQRQQSAAPAPDKREAQHDAPSTTAAEVNYPPSKHNAGSYAISEKQANRLYAIAKHKKWSVALAQSYVLQKFNKSVAQLNRKEYDAACEYFENTLCDDVVASSLENTAASKAGTWEPSKKGSAIDQLNKMKGGYVDHTAPPPFPSSDEIPF